MNQMEIEMSFKKVSFEDLPIEGRNAIQAYWLESMDLDVFDVRVKEYQFSMEWISLKEAKERCMRYTPDLKEDYADFEEYHQMYINHIGVERHGDSIWACIADLEDEWLLDGWHRFHYYVSNNLPLIPIVYVY